MLEDPYKHAMLVVACAGSGKSTTLVCRIKYLVDRGVPPEGIILTTFTRDAASDMEKKLKAVFGYDPGVVVGTIDGLALKFLQRYGFKNGGNNDNPLVTATTNVGEFAVKFLEFLKSPASRPLVGGTTHLFVDEFQDINDLQFKIIREFTKKGTHFTAVGDDAQNIYGFRGSNIKYILNFETYFDDPTVRKLTVNFRSTQPIVAFANATIEHNEYQIPKVMVSSDPNEPLTVKPVVSYFERASAQYETIKDRILGYRDAGHALDEIAVLCPQNSFLYQMEEVLTRHEVPNVLLDGKSEVRAALKPGHVCLLTIHKSKGLEWDVVFLIQMNDVVFPSNKSYQDVSESRRLFYVGATRPRKVLHISYSPVQDSKYVCRFVREVEDHLYVGHGLTDECYGLTVSGSTHGLDNATRHRTIAKRVEALRGEHYADLKQAGFFPDESAYEPPLQLYRPSGYEDFVVENELYGDFANFARTLLFRMIGEVRPASGGLRHESAMLAIHAVKLDYADHMIYKKYRGNFAANITTIVPLMEGKKMYANMPRIVTTFLTKHDDHDVVPVESEDTSTILNILAKLYRKSVETGIPIHHIPTFTDKYLPKEFHGALAANMERFADAALPWSSILPSIWEVSKCDAIVRDRRRRLLYKDVPPSNLKKYDAMWSGMWERLLPFLVSNTTSDSIVCNADVGSGETVHIMTDDTLYDVRCSADDGVKAEGVVAMLCKKEMVETNRPECQINRIGFVNLLRGSVSIVRVGTISSQIGLCEYLNSVRATAC